MVTVAVPSRRSKVSVEAASAMPFQVALPRPPGFVPVASPAAKPLAERMEPVNATSPNRKDSGPSAMSRAAAPYSPQNPYLRNEGKLVMVMSGSRSGMSSEVSNLIPALSVSKPPRDPSSTNVRGTPVRGSLRSSMAISVPSSPVQRAPVQ